MTRAVALLLAACSSGPTPEALTNPAPFGEAGAPRVAVGQPVPDFTVTDVDGGTVRLSDLRGAPVVLEFFNPDCPFVDYAHGSRGPLHTAPADWAAKGVHWLAINSNRAGANGTGVGVNQRAGRSAGLPRPIVLDEQGHLAAAFGATVTPTLAILDPVGTLAYFGGPDDAPLGDAPGEAPRDFLTPVLTALSGGQEAPFPRQKAYGCTIKR